MEKIKLEKEFIGKADVRGFSFKQVLNEKNFYIYEVTSKGTINKKNIVHYEKHYEVFKAKKDEDKNKLYPNSEDFGYTTWAFKDYNKALYCYNHIEEYLKRAKLK